MVKRIPIKNFSSLRNKNLAKKYRLHLTQQKLLNKYIPSEVKKILSYIEKNDIYTKNLKNIKYKDLVKLKKSDSKQSRLNYSKDLIDAITGAIGFMGSESQIIRDNLTLKETTAPKQIERLEKIAKKIQEGKFNPNVYLRNNEEWKKYIVGKKIKPIGIGNIYEIEERVRIPYNELGKNINNEPIFKKILNERGFNDEKLIQQLLLEFRLGNNITDIIAKYENKFANKTKKFTEVKSLKQIFNFLGKSEKELEFYEENKWFFKYTGGGSKENRADEKWVAEVRELRGQFNDQWAKKYFKDLGL